jgi:hypothetical protein
VSRDMLGQDSAGYPLQHVGLHFPSCLTSSATGSRCGAVLIINDDVVNEKISEKCLVRTINYELLKKLAV